MAGTARYFSANWNSTGSRDVGEPASESDTEPPESGAMMVAAVEWEERKFNRGVKSYRRLRRETRSFSSLKRRLEDDKCASSGVEEEEEANEVDVANAVAETGGRNMWW